LRRAAHVCGGVADHYYLFIDNTGVKNEKENDINYIIDANSNGLKITATTENLDLHLKNGQKKDPDLRVNKTIITKPEEAKRVVGMFRKNLEGEKYNYFWPNNDCGEVLDYAEEYLKTVRSFRE